MTATPTAPAQTKSPIRVAGLSFQPDPDAPFARRAAAAVLGVTAGAAPLVAALLLEAATPTHYNASRGFWIHVIGALAFAIAIWLVVGALLLLARSFYASPALLTAAMFAVLYGVVAGWRVFDAVNVLLDGPPVPSTVRFVSFQAHRKGPPTTRVSSWHGSGVEDIDTYTREDERGPERPMRVVVGRGALGREYVVSLTAL
jgi:hypothetical protein